MSDTDRPAAPARRTTIKDVARAVGVDQSLVSRVVSGDPRSTASPATRQRILDAVQTLGYQPNVVARGLRMARTWTIGFVLPDFENPLYNTIAKGVEAEAADLGYGTVLGAHAEGTVDDTFSRLLQQGRVDGLLVASANVRDSFLREVSARGLGPVVLVNRRVRGVKASVIVDDSAGVRLAVEHLRELGHEAVIGLFGPPTIDTAKRRRDGFESACADVGVRGIVVDLDSWDAAAGYAAAVRALLDYREATAVFASTFLMGVGVLRAARELRLAVPKALSVVALHDTQLADYLSPPMTTIAMPTEEMGRRAARLLVSMVDGQPPAHIVAEGPPQLIRRGSTGTPGLRRGSLRNNGNMSNG